MQLNNQQIKSLREVVNFILEFEKEDYLDWIQHEENPEGHVYYHADQFVSLLEDYRTVNVHRGLEIAEDGTVTGLK